MQQRQMDAQIWQKKKLLEKDNTSPETWEITFNYIALLTTAVIFFKKGFIYFYTYVYTYNSMSLEVRGLLVEVGSFSLSQSSWD